MKVESIFTHLRRVKLFQDVSDGELLSLAQSARAETKCKGSRILEEGSEADSCYVLASGRAKVVLSGADGAEVVLGMIAPSDLVGELSLLDHSSRSASLVAMEHCELIKISRAAFSELRSNRAFEDRLVVSVTLMLRRATEQLRAIYTYTSAERVAWSLARLASRTGQRKGGTIVVTPRPLHQELADMTGCSRETVSRTLLELKQSGSVTWSASSLTIEEEAFRQYLELEQSIGKATGRRFL
jgi:CRP/FNR family cyclic AMP-dependent transcriptional regulator